MLFFSRTRKFAESQKCDAPLVTGLNGELAQAANLASLWLPCSSGFRGISLVANAPCGIPRPLDHAEVLGPASAPQALVPLRPIVLIQE
jgi:hypothetical protein